MMKGYDPLDEKRYDIYALECRKHYSNIKYAFEYRKHYSNK